MGLCIARQAERAIERWEEEEKKTDECAEKVEASTQSANAIFVSRRTKWESRRAKESGFRHHYPCY